MQNKSKYPLQPLRELRDREVDAAMSHLGGAVRDREVAERTKLLAEKSRDEGYQRASSVRLGEAERMVRGQVRVVDLAVAEAWEYAARAELLALDQCVSRADERLCNARDGEMLGRSNLATKDADRKVVANDQERFTAALRSASLSAEEEANEEVFAARWSKP